MSADRSYGFGFLEVHLNFYERCQPCASRSNSLHRRERVGAITSPIRNCLISCALRDGGGALFSAFAGSSACPLHASGVTCRNERSPPAIDGPANVAPKPEAPDGGRRIDGRAYANSETAEEVRRQVAQ